MTGHTRSPSSSCLFSNVGVKETGRRRLVVLDLTTCKNKKRRNGGIHVNLQRSFNDVRMVGTFVKGFCTKSNSTDHQTVCFPTLYRATEFKFKLRNLIPVRQRFGDDPELHVVVGPGKCVQGDGVTGT